MKRVEAITRIDLRDALDMLPRWKRANDWNVMGHNVYTRARVLSDRVEKYLRPPGSIVQQMFNAKFPCRVERVNVNVDNIWTFHARLRVGSLMWLYRRNWRWQLWPHGRLPIYIRYRGKIIVWNGTHRMTLARLARRKVRARVYDLDKFIEQMH